MAKPAMNPMAMAPKGETTAQPAVMATRPANEPFSVIETSGLPYFAQVNKSVTRVAVTADKFVFKKIVPIKARVSSPVAATVDAPLNPNHANQRMKTPRAPIVKLWPGMTCAFPSLYFPIRGPTTAAPTRAATPPTICTAVDPAKSMKPI